VTSPQDILTAVNNAFAGDPGPPEPEPDDPPRPPEPNWPEDPGPLEPYDLEPTSFHVNGHRTIEEPEPDLYVDIAALLDGELPEPPKPVLLRRVDGHALLYAGRVNGLFGDPETGKTWVAEAACVEALRAERRVLFMDLDHNGVEAVVANLLLLGAPARALRDRNLFRYCVPDDRAEVRLIVEDCLLWRPAVAVIDSLGELLPMMGASSNVDDDYTLTNTNVLQPLADAGAAVITIDHLAKNPQSRASGPTGANAKRRAPGGTSIRVKAARGFVPGKGGSALLLVNKDRHGGVRKNCPTGEREQLAGTFVMDEPDANGAVGWRIIPPLELTAASLDGKGAEFLAAVRQIEGAFTAKDAALQRFGEDPPTVSQIKQAAYHLERLTDAGHLQQVSQGRRGAGAARWRLRETAGQGNPKSESLWEDETNPTANPKESEPQ
jgi:hypothetical protein